MSLSGQLEDVPLADVMQFVHLGRRTGTLALTDGRSEAEVGFHRGQIISAQISSDPRFSDFLVDQGFVDGEAMRQAWQRQGRPGQSIGQLVVQCGLLQPEELTAALAQQAEAAIYRLVAWQRGSFEFALDELRPNENSALFPGDTIPELGLNTQQVLLEATRKMDERQRGGEVATAAKDASQPAIGQPSSEDELRLGEAMALSEVSEAIAALDLDLPDDDLPDEVEPEFLPEAAPRRLQVVSPDRRLSEGLTQAIQRQIAVVVRVPLRDAGTRLPGEPSPTIVVLDLCQGHHSVQDLLAIRRSRPRSSIIAIVDSPELTTRAFEGGAVAAITGDTQAIAACFHSLVRTFQDAGPKAQSGHTQRAGFARLRRVLADIRSGLLSATMALNLMHIISESVERGVLFLVREERLTIVGAFGFSADGRPLAESTRSLALSLDLELDNDNAITRCISDGQPRSLSFEHAALPVEFARLLGRPRNGQVVVLPVLGAERVISVVYTDNGQSPQAIEDIELLELATAQVGVAFENELLRRQIERR